jgi:hypothetical protein
MGLSPEELADRQRRNRERRQQAKAAKLVAKAAAANVSVAEMRARIKANKAAAHVTRQVAERRRELMERAEILLAEAEWRGALLKSRSRRALATARTLIRLPTRSSSAATDSSPRLRKPLRETADCKAKRSPGACTI